MSSVYETQGERRPAPVSFHVLTSSLVAAAALVFAGAVYLFASQGGSLLTRLSGEIGEIVAKRAENLAHAGQIDEAIVLYRRALEQRFDEPEQRVWAMQRLARLLMEKRNYGEAAEIMKQALARDPNDGWNYGLLAKALQYSEQYPQLEEMSRNWLAWAQEKGNPTNMMLAHYYRGLALLDRGDLDAAAEAFLQGHEIEPAAAVGINAARLLLRTGRTQEAMPVLNWLLENATGDIKEEARALISAGMDG